MRFGHFFYPMKFDDSQDAQEIHECLNEAQLVEELGLDAIWFAEHYFTGECVYGDPLVFASAVAVKTKRIMLGFGILELPLHNPVRVAIQTALLDNLCQGRLVVGTGRGSNYNAFEYIGFGSTPDLGAAQFVRNPAANGTNQCADERTHPREHQSTRPVGIDRIVSEHAVRSHDVAETEDHFDR